MRVKETLALEKFTYNFTDDGDKMVNGVAITPGIYHTFLEIPQTELGNIASTIRDVPILTNHENRVENAIGRVTDSRVSLAEDAVEYTGFIDSNETEILRKIEKGIVSSTSIGFECEHICKICGNDFFSADCSHYPWDENFGILCKNVKTHELSVVSIPADKNATISTAMALDDFEDNFPDLYAQKQELRKNKGDKIMTDKKIDALKKEYEEQLASEVEKKMVLKTENEQLKAELKSKEDKLGIVKEELAEIRKAELKIKADKVVEFNEELGAGLSIEEIEKLSEEGLDRFIRMFENIKETRPNLKLANEGKPKYEGVKRNEDLSAKDSLFEFITQDL